MCDKKAETLWGVMRVVSVGIVFTIVCAIVYFRAYNAVVRDAPILDPTVRYWYEYKLCCVAFINDTQQPNMSLSGVYRQFGKRLLKADSREVDPQLVQSVSQLARVQYEIADWYDRAPDDAMPAVHRALANTKLFTALRSGIVEIDQLYAKHLSAIRDIDSLAPILTAKHGHGTQFTILEDNSDIVGWLDKAKK